MKYKLLILFVLTILIIANFSGCVDNKQEDNEEEKTNTELAILTIQTLNSGNYTKAYDFFDETVKSVMPIAQLQEIWKSIITYYGDFIEIVKTRETNESDYNIIYVTCNFSKLGFLDARLVFDENQLIAGLQFVPTDISSEYNPPNYADEETFTEEEITIGSGKWELPGTLSIPEGVGSFPAVVLVHGSGTNDRDETIGPNKPLKDIAWGLASQGIAVLRYDKRTYYYRDVFIQDLNFTVKEEVTDDAIAAVEYLSSHEKIDPNRIFVLGHSLGGMLAPRIASLNERIVGIIILAGPARHLEDLIINQTMYIANLDSEIDETESMQIAEIEKMVTQIKELNMSDSEMVMGAPLPYWADLASYEPVETAKTLNIPMLILQGKRDYQVTYEDDFKIWNETFADDNATLISYESLNHLFMSGNGDPNNSEYMDPSNVEKAVIDDISNWIKNLF